MHTYQFILFCALRTPTLTFADGRGEITTSLRSVEQPARSLCRLFSVLGRIPRGGGTHASIPYRPMRKMVSATARTRCHTFTLCAPAMGCVHMRYTPVLSRPVMFPVAVTLTLYSVCRGLFCVWGKDHFQWAKGVLPTSGLSCWLSLW